MRRPVWLTIVCIALVCTALGMFLFSASCPRFRSAVPTDVEIDWPDAASHDYGAVPGPPGD